MEVLVIDYGAGNLTSVMKALRAVGASPVSGSGAQAVARRVRHRHSRRRPLFADGVDRRARARRGSHRHRARRAGARHLSRPAVAVRRQRRGADGRRPRRLSGRCFHSGSDCLPARDPATSRSRMSGGTRVEPSAGPSRLLDGIPPSSFAYFTHTYAAPVVDDTVATTTHGAAFSCRRGTRPRVRRAVSSGEIRRRGTAAARQLCPHRRGRPLTCSRGASSRASTCATARS